jgi:predicted nucleic acid-binding protein
MESLIFDTSFLIDFQKERNRGPGAAHAFLERNGEAYAYLPMTAYGEYAEGFESRSDPAFLSVVESFEIIPVTREVADSYASIARKLRRDGLLIGANDMWIAATAVQRDWPLVTRNLDHFARIPGIRLQSY